ncbi:SDR family NAD(P)-dependent oxidoreductase [Gordonia sp. HNM0687]|uniref:SDR family NAD(P)-dependent oxidoreductase n=1 Tax=Gordonia mangrovi TaxID=2665643 RepID=A0A6L7GY69_9ACTN|nr:SDR family oxidoreductase [Gordonia mangrovi]MXP23615.1 SDR family NAD(P)-dependent oxidoreductase [Gordonia mangrovi]UVF79681.1 SDR family oxidoreductase [Gordonia mangrovi]
MDYRDKTALITGASGGIGAEFAHTLAAEGSHLILVARSEDKLAALADELAARHGIRVEVIPADLSLPGAAETLITEVDKRDLTVDMLINNAGFGTHGDLVDADPGRISDEVALNVATLTDLTTVYFQRMAHRGVGAIVNVASTAGFQPIPHMAVYGATKAYVLSLSEALWWEGRQLGVKVLALCPGATDTDFFDVAGSADAAVGARRTTRQVVDTALRALDGGKPSVVDGVPNRIMAASNRFAPRRLVLAITERAVRPRRRA